MPDSAGYALHRPELANALMRGDEKIAQLMAADTRNYAAGTTLIEADSEHPYIYRLRKGWAGRVRILPDGRAQFILIFPPGDLFAVKSMLVTRHPDSVEILANATVEVIDYRKLREAYDQDPDISLRCTWQVIEEERRLHNWVVGLGRGNAEERLALLLLDFRARLVLPGTIAPDSLEYELPMTQEQLGDHLGISTVHVNRVMRQFRERGVASMRGGTVRILNLEVLAQIAYPLLDTFERASPEFVGGKAG